MVIFLDFKNRYMPRVETYTCFFSLDHLIQDGALR